MERCFLNLKIDHGWQKDSANHAEATNDIADYFVGFYYGIRLHSNLGNLSPNAFKRELISKKQPAVRNYLPTAVDLLSANRLSIGSLLTVISSFLKVSSYLPDNRRHKHCCPPWPVTLLLTYAQYNA